LFNWSKGNIFLLIPLLTNDVIIDFLASSALFLAKTSLERYVFVGNFEALDSILINISLVVFTAKTLLITFIYRI